MKKRLSTIALCLIAVLSVIFLLVACGDEETPPTHTHTFENVWSSDGDYHWYKASCEHKNEVTSKAKHTFDSGTVTKEPTETEEGELTQTCSVCKRVKVTKIPALGKHVHTANSWVNNQNGTHTGVCVDCGEVTIPCSYSEAVTAPTCTEQGFTTYTCACGYAYDDDFVKALGHKYEDKFSKNDSYHWYAATCEHSGEQDRYEKHSFSANVVNPTCTEQGYTEYSCECGYSYKGNEVDPTGHKVNTWTLSDSTLVNPQKCEYSVTHSGTCETCGKTAVKTEKVEKHAPYWAITTPATCQQEGVMSYICANEGCINNIPNASTQTKGYTNTEAHTWSVDNDASTDSVTAYACPCGATKKTVLSTDGNVNVDDSDFESSNEIELPDATIGFDGDAKENLSGSGSVNVSAGTLDDTERQEAIDKAGLTDEQKESLKGKKVYNFTVSTTTNSDISNLGGVATIRIQYTLSNGETPEDIVIWYLSNGELESITPIYSEDANGVGYVTFTTTHFSYYTVAQLTPALRCEKDGHIEVTVNPTCTENGYKVCSRCGEVTEVISALGHSWQSSVKTEASCQTNGISALSCRGCGESYEQVIPATGHSYVLSDYVAPSCVSVGGNTYSCVDCQSTYTLEIRSTGHSFVTNVKAPTCTDAGYTEKTCTACGTSIIANSVEQLGHTYLSAWVGAASGHYHYCVSCGAASAVEAHTPGADATETTAQICTVCDYIITPALGHTHTLTKVEANEAGCTIGGNLEYYVCQCGKWFMDEGASQLITDHLSVFVDAKGHTPINVGEVKATCTEGGFTAGLKCSSCDEVLRGIVATNPTGHSYKTEVTAPTCTEDGFTTYTCGCGHSYEGDKIEKLGHKYTGVVTAPTCTEEGYTVNTCVRCKNEERVNEKAPLGHAYNKSYTSDKDYHWYDCDRCDSTTEKLPHAPNHEEATESHGISCTQCGYIIAEAINHTHKVEKTMEGKAPSCTSVGSVEYYICSCGNAYLDKECTEQIKDFTVTVIPALGHDEVATGGTEPTCTEAGMTESYSCKRCGAKLSSGKVIPALGHKQLEISEKLPTCTEGGYTAGVYCDRCQTYTSGHEYLEPTGHHFEEGVCLVCGEKDEAYEPDTKDYVYYFYHPLGMEIFFYEGGKFTAIAQRIDSTGNVVETQKMEGTWSIEEDTGYICAIFEGYPQYFEILEDGSLQIVQVICEHPNMVEERVEPTCTTEGYVRQTCPDCGFGQGGSLGMLKHNFVDGKCTMCGESEGNDGPIDQVYMFYAAEVDGGKIMFYTDGTCILERYVYTGDGEVMIEEVKGVFVEKELYLIAKFDDMTYTVKYRPAETCKHENVSEIDRLDPSCTSTGYVEYRCNDCGESFGSILEPTGHIYGDDGVCERCGKKEGEELEYRYSFVYDGIELYLYDDKTYTLVAYIPTDDGKEQRIELTGEWYFDEKKIICVDLNGEIMRFTATAEGSLIPYEPIECDHPNMEENRTDPSCTGPGFVYYSCPDCGYNERQSLPALPHKYLNGACVNCGVKEPQGGDYLYYMVQQGMEIYFYEDYTFTTKMQMPDASGNIINVEQKGTWYIDEKTGYIAAEIEGEIGWFEIFEDGSVFPVVAGCLHNNKQLIESREPTCTSDGYREYLCLDCNATMKELIPPMGHMPNEDGVCANCGETAEKTVEVGIGNEDGEFLLYSDGTATWEYKRNVDGKVFIVTEDGKWTKKEGVYVAYFETNTFTFVDPGYNGCTHENKYIVDQREPTCTTEGYVMYRCDECKTGITETIGLLDHNYENGICTNCGADQNGRVVFEFNYEGYRYILYSTYVAEKEVDGKVIVGEWGYMDDGQVIVMVEDSYFTIHPSLMNCDHENKKLVSELAPTCTSKGYIQYYCPDCDNQIKEDIARLEHSFGEDGACVNCGLKEGEDAKQLYYFVEGGTEIYFYADYTYLCIGKSVSDDGSVEEIRVNGEWYIDAETGLLHTELMGMQLVFIINEDGSLEWVEEDACDHNYEFYFEHEATCMVEGYIEYRCKECGYINRESTGFAFHKFNKEGFCIYCYKDMGGFPSDEVFFVIEQDGYHFEFTVDGSCIITYNLDGKEMRELSPWKNDGYTLSVSANYIEFTFTYETENVGCKHENAKEIVLRAPTCDEWGYIEYYCPDCDMKSSSEVEPMGHSFNEKGVCERCGYVDAPECYHGNRKEVSSQMPTCEEWGYIEYYCEDCYQYFTEQTAALAPLGHIFDENYTCERCGYTESMEDNYVEFHYAEVEDGVIMFFSNGTCSLDKFITSSDGSTMTITVKGTFVEKAPYLIATVDGKTYMVEYESGQECAHETRYVVLRVEPTCDVAGYIEYSCKDCGNSFCEELAPFGHSFNEKGVCERCGYVDAPECYHGNRREVSSQMPTCEEWGYIEYYCEDCYQYFREQTAVLAPFGHIFDEMTNECINCGYKVGVSEPEDDNVTDGEKDLVHVEYMDDGTLNFYSDYTCVLVVRTETEDGKVIEESFEGTYEEHSYVYHAVIEGQIYEVYRKVVDDNILAPAV